MLPAHTPTPSTRRSRRFSRAKVIKVQGPFALQLADLVLHMADLQSADEYLTGINQVQEHHLREGLMVAALVRLYKCFGVNAARKTVCLDPNLLFSSQPDGLDTYKFYKHLRNKHVVHDENSFSQAPIGAVLNKREAPYKIERVLNLAVASELVTQENFSNMKLLVEIALKWVRAEIERVSQEVTNALELESYDTLLARDELTISPADVGKVGKTRK